MHQWKEYEELSKHTSLHYAHYSYLNRTERNIVEHALPMQNGMMGSKNQFCSEWVSKKVNRINQGKK